MNFLLFFIFNLSAHADTKFAILGDTQRTSRLERIVLGREDNKVDQINLIKELASEKPAFLVHVGDLTFDASSDKLWSFYDELMKPLETLKIPIWVALGNHEYWDDEEKSFAHLETRFPYLKKSRWYSRIEENVGFIFLDTNDSKLGNKKWAAQVDWYKNTMLQMNIDSKVKSILVFAHHPPFTNSTNTGDEEHVQKAFLPDFLSSAKTRAFFSGHAHGYERFSKQGKMFVVTGGGGGPRVTLKTGEKAKHEDLFVGSSPRPFNYILVSANAGALQFEVKGLKKGETKKQTLEKF